MGRHRSRCCSAETPLRLNHAFPAHGDFFLVGWSKLRFYPFDPSISMERVNPPSRFVLWRDRGIEPSSRVNL